MKTQNSEFDVVDGVLTVEAGGGELPLATRAKLSLTTGGPTLNGYVPCLFSSLVPAFLSNASLALFNQRASACVRRWLGSQGYSGQRYSQRLTAAIPDDLLRELKELELADGATTTHVGTSDLGRIGRNNVHRYFSIFLPHSSPLEILVIYCFTSCTIRGS